MSQKKSKKNKKHRGLIFKLWRAFGIGVAVVILFMFTVRLGVWGALPDFSELENPQTKLASEIYTADEELIGKLFFQEDRTNSDFDDIPEHMVQALVATEDHHFYKHSGIDGEAVARALFYMGKKGGGSTITQQLALNMFHARAKSLPARLLQKTKEWILAVELEKRYTKQEIVLMYFNTVPWGNSYGIKSASKRYFNKPTAELKLEEAAVLVGMLKAPTAYNPIRNPERSKQRRNVVMFQMKRHGFITPEAYDSLKQLDLVTDYNFADHNQGMATYFRSHLTQWMKDWTKRYEEATGIKYNIYDDGLKIYTTLDSRLQAYAEKAVDDHMKQLQKQFYAETKRRGKDPWYKDNPHGDGQVYDKDYLNRMIRRTHRYRSLKKQYKSQDSIEHYLSKRIPMTVFSWEGDIDTVFSPYDSLRYYKQILHCGFMSLEPQTGHVKAWVGGINHKYFQYDHVNVHSNRQVGSTFKPLVYARALDDEKIHPCEEVSTGPVIVEYAGDQTWSPRNSGGTIPDQLTFQMGIAEVDQHSDGPCHETIGAQLP